MLDIIYGGAGTGKSYEMMKRIKCAVSKGTSLGKKVYAIVPDQFNFEYNRLLYDFMGMEDFNRMEIINFSRAAKYIFIKYGGLKGKYADDTVRNIIMFEVISRLRSEHSLEFYGRQAAKTRFVADALEIVKTFSAAGVSPEQLMEKLHSLDETIRPKAKDIALLYSEYMNSLEKHGFKDSGTDLIEAAKKASEHGFFKDTEFFIDEFKSFTPDEYELLKVMIRDCGRVTVSLTTEDEKPKNFSLFDTVNTTMYKLINAANDAGVQVRKTFLSENRRFAFPELGFMRRNILRAKREVFDGKCNAVTVYEAAEPYAEADYVAAEICRLVREEGYRYSDIAVTSRSPENYMTMIEAAFRRSDIPLYTDASDGISHKALVVFIRTALKLVSSRSFSTEEILRYIKTGFSGLDDEKADILEEYCYRWNVEGKMWSEPFRIADENDAAAEEARKTVIVPLENLRKKASCGKADGICCAVADFLEEAGIARSVEEAAKNAEADSEALIVIREAKQLWDMLCGLLQSFYRTLGESEISAAEFAELFDSCVSGMKLSAPPKTLDCVSFTAAHTSRFSNPKAIFVIGANEGAFPLAPKPSPLFSDKDTERFRAADIEIGGSMRERNSEERFVAYSVLSAAREKLYVTYPVANVSGSPLYPSFAVKQLEGMFGDIKLTEKDLGTLFFCTTEQNGYYQYIKSFRRNDADIASLRAALEDHSPENRRKLKLADEPVKGRHSLRKENAERIFGQNISLSASRLEDYRKCPFVYFCKKGLHIQPRQRVDVSAPSKGTAIHYCLCEFLKEYDKDSFVKMERKDISEVIKTKLGEYYASDEVGGSYGKTKRFLAAFGRMAETLTDIIYRLKLEFLQSDFSPSSFEYTLSYSENSDEKPVTVQLPDKTKVSFVGAVDRIDTFVKDGMTYVRVVDYKTGSKVFSLADIYYGINMQMLLYIFAVTDPDAPLNEGKYHDALPAGVLYMHAKDNVPSLGRNPTEEEKLSYEKKGCKMDGVVIADTQIAGAMENGLNGTFIPVKIKNDGDFYSNSSVITEDQIAALRKYSADILKETAMSIKNGEIEADPLRNGSVSPCSYCDYSSVCGNYPNIIHRDYDPEAAKKMSEKLDSIIREENEKGEETNG
ncbi:MAG: PD-(D/E)XK nuclease family protein [Oscillospiraceae bacterium]